MTQIRRHQKIQHETLLLLLVAVCGVSLVASCSEAVCASLVTKCMLLKSCDCNMTDKSNCTCCTECHQCLQELYVECCSCVDLCPARSPHDGLHGSSTVDHLPTPEPGLFNILTREPDPLHRWTSHTYPSHLDLLFTPQTQDSQDPASQDSPSLDKPPQASLGGFSALGSSSQLDSGSSSLGQPTVVYRNCTVAYISQCTPLHQCRAACLSMGAARLRWFHDYGCCQCVGDTCLQFGRRTADCLRCPPADGLDWGNDEEEDDMNDD